MHGSYGQKYDEICLKFSAPLRPNDTEEQTDGCKKNPAMYKVILSRIYDFVCKKNSYCLVKEKRDVNAQLSSDSSGLYRNSPFSP